MRKWIHWEHGSEFHWPSIESLSTSSMPWEGSSTFAGTGRGAIASLIRHGAATRRWRRIWIPSYFCQEVVGHIVSQGIPVQTYPDNPLKDHPTFPESLTSGDMLFVVNFFGLRQRPTYDVPATVDIVEDHTHDPWSPWALASHADYCVASLRKTLPVPDGGVCWSPVRHDLPPQPPIAKDHNDAVLDKLSAMLLKSLYLETDGIEKAAFRTLAQRAERGYDKVQISAISEFTSAVLPCLPIASWRRQRLENFRTLADGLANEDWASLLEPTADGCCPFSGVLLCDTSGRRDYVRLKLIEKDVYPTILWPLDHIVVEPMHTSDRELSGKLLSIHCDMRYDAQDMRKVVEIVRMCGQSWTA